MNIFPTNVRAAAWWCLAFSLVMIAAVIHTPDAERVLCALFFFALAITGFALRRLEKKRATTFRRRIQNTTDNECQSFALEETQLRKHLAAGELHFLVEWWENDNIYINENAHMLFIFRDGTYLDFVLHQPIVDKLSALLRQHGIEWEWRLQLHFDSNILYPPQYAGQKFYKSDGTTRQDIGL